jgi:hypothetical protein
MGTAALTRWWPAAARTRAPTTACRLVFDDFDGPLVAVCGLVGGSGASTLSICLATQAARESSRPVLLAELGRARGTLAALTQTASTHGLAELAELVAADDAPASPFAEVEPGLRLVASAPARGGDSPSRESLADLLVDARAAHGLVVVDCSSAWQAGSDILTWATHIVWTVPVRRGALTQVGSIIRSPLMPPVGKTQEALVGVVLDAKPPPVVRELRRLGSERSDRLVLMPCCAELAGGDCASISDRTANALTRLARFLRSSP